jgi:hypothetical protein
VRSVRVGGCVWVGVWEGVLLKLVVTCPSTSFGGKNLKTAPKKRAAIYIYIEVGTCEGEG